MNVQAAFVAEFGGALTRPEQDVEPYIVNMAGANRAQNALVAWQGVGEIPQAIPTAITAIVGPKGTDALAAMGLEPLPSEL